MFKKSRFVFALTLVVGALAPLAWLATVVPDEGLNFPSDDAWIHQVFARNLARSGMFAYNAGERSAGVTAPLWTMLVSEVHFWRVPFLPGTLALSITGHVLWVAALFWLMRGVWPNLSPWWPAAAAMLFALLGPPSWFALSGLETCLFFALGTLTAVAIARGRPALAGFCAAASFPLRPEGAVLIAMAGGWWLWRLVRERRRPVAGEVVGYVVLPLLFGVPVLAENLFVGHSLLPTTYYGRHWLYAGTSPESGLVYWKGPIVLAFYWYRYLQFWMLSQNDVSNAVKIFTDPVVISQLGLVAAAFMLFARRLNAGFAFFIVWVFLHNLAYSLFLPNFGTAGRYGGANFALFAVSGVFGAQLLYGWAKGGVLRAVPFVFLGAAFFSAAGSYVQWRIMYSDNVYHITNVHEAAGKWVAANVPPGERVAAFDIGAFGYYANHYIVDLGGLLDRRTDYYLRSHTMSTYVRERGARYIAMMELEAPDIIPLGERFGFYRDIGTKMGMTPIRAWELPIARRRWLTITAVAYPTLTLYEAHYY